MHSYKKITIIITAIVLTLSIFSGCINNLLGDNTSFILKNWDICDDEGFPGIKLIFTNSDRITVKIYNPTDSLVDTESFLNSQNDEKNQGFFHLASYGETASLGNYQIKIYDKNNDKIYSKKISISGKDLSILSCEQKWWKRQPRIGNYSLLGLNLSVKNNGDMPIYPYNVDIIMDSSAYSGNVIPTVVLPGETNNIYCFIYRHGTPNNDEFTLNLKDRYDTALASDSFSVNVIDNVEVKEFSWDYKSSKYQVEIPMLDFFYDYYNSIDRIQNEDYSLYVFDQIDDLYMDLIVDDCIMYDFLSSNDVERINYAASFVQHLDYKKDSLTNDSYEYPRYPVETLFNNGGDCEDKAIFTACILDHLGYQVSLLRLPEHMAVGVSISEDLVPSYEKYIDDYFFLECTTSGKTVGFIPNEYRSIGGVDVFEISSRALLTHIWKDDSLTIFYNTDIGDFVKVIVYVENLGIVDANNIKVEGVFYDLFDVKINTESEIISSIEPGFKDKVILTLNIPSGRTTIFKTNIYLNDEIVDTRESADSFPT